MPSKTILARNWQDAQKNKISTSTHCVQNGQKDGRQKYETFQETFVQCSNVQKRLERSARLNYLKNHRNLILIFSLLKDEDFSTMKKVVQKTFIVDHCWSCFIVDSVFNKQNDWIIMFGNDFSEYPRVPTTKHPASIMMLDVVASNREKMPLVWFERGYRLTSAVYKKIWRWKFFHGSRRLLINKITYFQQEEAPVHTVKTVHKLLDANMIFWPKDLGPPQSSDLIALDFSL